MTDRLRRCEWSGHQHSGSGWFHRWVDFEGETRAIIELDSGAVIFQPFYIIRFTEPPQQEEP